MRREHLVGLHTGLRLCALYDSSPQARRPTTEREGHADGQRRRACDRPDEKLRERAVLLPRLNAIGRLVLYLSLLLRLLLYELLLLYDQILGVKRQEWKKRQRESHSVTRVLRDCGKPRDDGLRRYIAY